MAVRIDPARRDQTARRVDLSQARRQNRTDRRDAPIAYAEVGAVTVGGGGDIGIALPDANGNLMVHFPHPGGALRGVAPLRLPQHETAFAMTVHKSQSSEFEHTALVLSAQAATCSRAS